MKFKNTEKFVKLENIEIKYKKKNWIKRNRVFKNIKRKKIWILKNIRNFWNLKKEIKKMWKASIKRIGFKNFWIPFSWYQWISQFPFQLQINEPKQCLKYHRSLDLVVYLLFSFFVYLRRSLMSLVEKLFRYGNFKIIFTILILFKNMINAFSTLWRLISFGWNRAAEKGYMKTKTHEKC